jgi:hypothetical protein
MPASKLPLIVDGNLLLGTWKLKSYVVTTAAGVRSTPYGKNPTHAHDRLGMGTTSNAVERPLPWFSAPRIGGHERQQGVDSVEKLTFPALTISPADEHAPNNRHRSGRQANPEQPLVLTADGKDVDEQRTRQIFAAIGLGGRTAGASAAEDLASLGYNFSIFKYKDRYYFDVFRHDPAGTTARRPPDSNILNVFLRTPTENTK